MRYGLYGLQTTNGGAVVPSVSIPVHCDYGEFVDSFSSPCHDEHESSGLTVDVLVMQWRTRGVQPVIRCVL